MAHIECHDSTRPLTTGKFEMQNGIDCVVANLPWGQNSIEYINENRLILENVRSRIQAGIPCAIITRDDSIQLLESRGFDVLGQAFVPQREFVLPKGKKRKKKHFDNDKEEHQDSRNNICVITIARSS